MLSFVNNIRITGPGDNAPRPLTQEEFETIRSLFFRKSKPYFDFEEIARRIAGKGKYACKEERTEAPYRFNFARTATVSGCPVTASLQAIFGDDWITEIRSLYLLGAGKNEDQMLNDVWHALFSFNDEGRLRSWACEKLQLTDEQAKAFAAIKLPQDYAALSLNAIGKILVYLRCGYRYDEAVFLANLRAALPKDCRLFQRSWIGCLSSDASLSSLENRDLSGCATQGKWHSATRLSTYCDHSQPDGHAGPVPIAQPDKHAVTRRQDRPRHEDPD